MSLRVPVLTTTGLVCHSGCQYSSLTVLYVTYHYVPCMRTSTYHYMPCMPYLYQIGMSLIVPVRTSVRALYGYHVYKRTSIEIFYSGIPPRVRIFHGRRTVLNIGGGGAGVRERENLSQPSFVAGHEGLPPCISKLLGAWSSCPLFICLCFLNCQQRVPLVASTILVCQYSPPPLPDLNSKQSFAPSALAFEPSMHRKWIRLCFLCKSIPNTSLPEFSRYSAM